MRFPAGQKLRHNLYQAESVHPELAAAPRFIWDFTGKGKGKFFANYGRLLETPIPLDVKLRAGGNGVQTDFNLRAFDFSLF